MASIIRDLFGDSARRATEAAQAQEQAATDLAASEDQRRKNQESADTATKTAAAARARQQEQGDQAQGRRSTILTGDLGVVNDPTVARKTILGA